MGGTKKRGGRWRKKLRGRGRGGWRLGREEMGVWRAWGGRWGLGGNGLAARATGWGGAWRRLLGAGRNGRRPRAAGPHAAAVPASGSQLLRVGLMWPEPRERRRWRAEGREALAGRAGGVRGDNTEKQHRKKAKDKDEGATEKPAEKALRRRGENDARHGGRARRFFNQ